MQTQTKIITSVDQAVSQFETHTKRPISYRYVDFYQPCEGVELFQGDVILIPTALKEKIASKYAMLLSNTCDMQRGRKNGKLLALPLRSLPTPEQVPDHKRAQHIKIYEVVTKYRDTSTFFLPPVDMDHRIRSFDQMYANFSEAISLDAKEINDRLAEDPNLRVLTLSQVGFYLFLVKISLHLLRPDDRFPELRP